MDSFVSSLKPGYFSQEHYDCFNRIFVKFADCFGSHEVRRDILQHKIELFDFCHYVDSLLIDGCEELSLPLRLGLITRCVTFVRFGNFVSFTFRDGWFDLIEVTLGLSGSISVHCLR